MNPFVGIPLAVLYFIFSVFYLVVLAFLPKKIVFRIYQNLDKKEVAKRIGSMREYLSSGDHCLDVGAGSGRFGKAIEDELGVHVTGVDVVDYRDASIPIYVYDGKKLPFPDKFFDVVFIAFVMHHINFDNQKQIMKELIRCSRGRIIVFEDTYSSWWQRLFIMWNDYHVNILQGYLKVLKGYSKKGVTDMPISFTFRSVAGWKGFFSQFPVKLVSISLRHSGYKPLNKVTFCLEV